jgi:hypothetical protein
MDVILTISLFGLPFWFKINHWGSFSLCLESQFIKDLYLGSFLLVDWIIGVTLIWLSGMVIRVVVLVQWLVVYKTKLG